MNFKSAIFWLCTIFLCCLPPKVKGQQENFFPNIKYITSDNGLSQSEVTAILQDSKGFLWVGTRGGLNRYDGSTFKVFQNEIGNSNSLNNNSIETLFEDSNGYLWIGTKSNGFSRYNPVLHKFEQLEERSENIKSLLSKRVISITESSTKEIWLGTFQSGLYIYNPKTGSIKHLITDLKITDIIKDSNDNMWVTTNYGFYVFSQDGIELNYYNIPNVNIEFTSIIEDTKSGLFFLGTWNNGLYEFNPKLKSFKQYIYPKSKINDNSSNNAYHLFLDNERLLWIGTWGAGVNRFNIDTKEFINFDLSSYQDKGSRELYNDVLCVYQDRLGILWFGTNGGGICKIDKSANQFGLLDSEMKNTNLPNEPVWSIYEDKDQFLWVGFKGNNNIYYSKTGINFSYSELPTFSIEDSNRKLGVKTMFEDKENNFWIANNHGLFDVQKTAKGLIFEQIRILNQKTSEREQLSKITALYQSKDGIFWIGTQQDGLKKSINPGNPKSQTFENYLINERISSILEDSKGNIWVGTYRGLNLYQPKIKDFEKFSKKPEDYNSLSSDIIICLFEDSSGNLWVGTPNGLNLVVKENNSFSFKSFQQKDGLPNNYIHSIQEDAKGNLWIGTNKGISKYSIKEKSFYNYDVNDGLRSNSFTENAAIKDSKGKFYFGGIYGLNVFHPDSINTTNVPPVIFTGLKISGQDIQAGEKYNNRIILENSMEYNKNITLTHKENIFSINYTALDLHSSSGYSFSVKMEGLEEDWHTANLQKNVTYSNLNAGEYTFMVKTVSDEEISDSPITSLNIKILPPFWKTWPAFLLYILVFVGLLYLYRHIITKQSALKNRLELSRLKRKKEEELAEMKTRFFTDIAHEIRTPLSLITGPLETLLKNNLDKQQQTSYLTTMNYHTKRLLTLVSQLLDFRKAESGKMTLQVAHCDIIKFSKEIFVSFRELAASKGIEFVYETDDKYIALTFDSNKMEIVLCNLLTNAIKFTPDNGRVILSIKKETSILSEFPLGYCEICVSDDGIGMTQEMIERIFNRFYQIANTKSINIIGTGIGLALVKSIVELHKGKVFVESELNKGSKFIVQIPLGEEHFSKTQFIDDFKKSEDSFHYQIERVVENKNDSISQNVETRTNKPKLLIVEDNPEIRSFVKSVFEDSYSIIEAENGKIGFDKAKAYLPSLIISDLMMPEMDGLELCNKLRSTEETLQIPIILLTARTSNVFKEEGYNSGADIYVTKPFHPSVLKAQVEGLLNSRQRLRDLFSKKITLQSTTEEVASLDEKFLNKAMEIVEDNLTNENLNRDFLASKLATSSSTLYRKIKGLTGFDTTVFIRSIRLKKAAQMIINEEDNISGVAYQVGFNDLKYFRKCFKEQFGVSPSKFIKSTK